ncbi:MAG: hypothetical protein ACQXXE_08720 [Candidatus Bathyarchaeia archaeon]|jgi:hypothetical protein
MSEESVSRSMMENNVFEFTFSAENDPRKRIPYVAKLKLTDGKITREFYPMSRTWGHRSVHVYGTYHAQVGDIIEIRWGGSWKNDYRDWYVVNENGQLKMCCSIYDSEKKFVVLQYLGGKITLNELLSK